VTITVDGDFDVERTLDIKGDVTLMGNGTITYTGNPGLFDVQSGTLTLDSENLTLKRNSEDDGSVVVVNGGTFEMKAGTITGATQSGVVVNSGGTFTMTGGTITDNTASGNGGGVRVENGGTFVFEGGKITNNEATNGGGVYVASGGLFDMSTIGGNGEITSNIATGDGGGVHVSAATHHEHIRIEGGLIAYNEASGVGGGVFFGFCGFRFDRWRSPTTWIA
jgi:lipopolysaccharide export system protein LptA